MPRKRNGKKGRIGVLIVRNATRLLSEALSEALKRETSVRLLSSPLTTKAAIDFCRSNRPDVVLIEATDTPAAALHETVGPIRGACDGAPVVLLADAIVDDAFLVAGLEAGASGVVDAAAGIHEVLWAVRVVAEGKQAVDPQRVASAVERAARSRERLELVGLLSDREREVLLHLSRGLRNSEIADRLAISPRTVEKHVHNILQKLQVPSRTAAVVLTSAMGDPLHLGMRRTP